MTLIDRRRWLLSGLALAPAAIVLPLSSARAAERVGSTPMGIRFEHLHTGERLELEHVIGRPPGEKAAAALNRLLRDFRTGEATRMDTGLLDQLAALVHATGSDRPFEVISGFRSRSTNRALRRKSRRVARASLHMQGRAIDIRLPDVPLAQLREVAEGLELGGVGYYPGADFIHIDTGPVRRW